MSKKKYRFLEGDKVNKIELAIVMGLLALAIAWKASAAVPPANIGGQVLAPEKREKCTWNISYYLAGKKQPPEISDHAWLLTEQMKADLFGPFTSGCVFVEPGKASYTCDGKTVHIVTQPLPRGSLLLLGKDQRK